MVQLVPDRLWPDPYWIEFQQFYSSYDHWDARAKVVNGIGEVVGSTFNFVQPANVRRLALCKIVAKSSRNHCYC